MANIVFGSNARPATNIASPTFASHHCAHGEPATVQRVTRNRGIT